jgi:hypothetical protein
LHTPWQRKVFTKLLGLSYKILYKKGAHNKVADALSRRPSETAECLVISVCQPQWLDQVTQSYEQDPYCQEIIRRLVQDSSDVPHFSLKEGLLRYKNRVWLGCDSELQL